MEVVSRSYTELNKCTLISLMRCNDTDHIPSKAELKNGCESLSMTDDADGIKIS